MSISIVMLLLNHLSPAQVKQISGIVTDGSTKEPIPGVSINAKEYPGIGTITDNSGRYQLELPEDATALIYSFIGMRTREIEIGDQSIIDVELVQDLLDLEEVVVIGYGVQKRKLVTGATAQVDGTSLENRNATTALQALQGQTAGINITSTSGQPGEDMKVVIRGLGTVGESKPLFIVDGVPTGDIEYLNSSDIESIDILKDAASSAIYGSRAANGVVLITTKRGVPGQSSVSFDAYYGFQNIFNKIEMLDARDYAIIMNEQHLNSGGSPSSMPFDVNNLPSYVEDGVANTDWIRQMMVKNAVTDNYVFSVSGGNEQSVYSTSIAYTGQEGIIGGADYSNYQRYSARFNSENKLFDDRLIIGENLTLAYTKDNGIKVGNQYYNSFRGAFNTSPLLPVYDDNGEFFNTADTAIKDQNGDTYWLDQETNPYASMILTNQVTNNGKKLVGNIYAEIEIIKNLKFRTSLGLDMFDNESRSYTPEYQLSIYSFNNFTKVTQRLARGYKTVLDNLLSYNYVSNQHRFDAMAGVSAEEYQGSWIYGENVDLAFYDLEHAYLNNATNTEPARMKIQGAPDSNDKILSYFGRVQYSFNETYLFNATFRADGSSKFAEGNRWGFFPSFSAGWVLSNEDFMANSNIFNFLKLRASWGQNGNQSIRSHQYLAPIKFTQATYPFGDDPESTVNGAYPSRLPNEDLKWESSEQIDIGLDSRLLQSKLSVSLDLYRKSSRGWLIVAPVLATAGTDPPYINGGNVINSGVELIGTYYGSSGEFNYTLSANGAYNKNRILDIPTEDGIIHGDPNVLYNNSLEFYRAETGHPIGFFWGWETDGIFQTPDEVTEHTSSDGTIIQPAAVPGDLRYVDQNDDGVIDDDDKIDLGNPNPDLMYGFSFSCDYRNIDLSVYASGVAGNQVVQSYRNHSDQWANYTTEILDRWNGTGTSETIPRVTKNNINYKFSDIFVKDAGFLRINNITLGYDFSGLIETNMMSKCRLFVSVQNLYTITKYTGMDPEVGFGITDSDDPSDNYSSGIDLGYYPRPTTILFGVSAKF